MDKNWYEYAHSEMDEMLTLTDLKDVLGEALLLAVEEEDILVVLPYYDACNLYDYLAYGSD